MIYPYPAPWLTPETTAGNHLGVEIARRALLCVGICEDPPGSNRSPEIDEWLADLGVPLGSPWCAAMVAAVFKTCHAKTPAGAAASSTRAWLAFAGDLSSVPMIGSATLYGKRATASEPARPEHIGILVRNGPLLMDVQGNTRLDSSPEREGIAVDLKRVNEAWLLGYIHPRAEVSP